MYIKKATLEALNSMNYADSVRAARKLSAYFGHGMEYGLEGFELENGGFVEYVNTGDEYSYTLIYFEGCWFEGCWGDIVELYDTERG